MGMGGMGGTGMGMGMGMGGSGTFLSKSMGSVLGTGGWGGGVGMAKEEARGTATLRRLESIGKDMNKKVLEDTAEMILGRVRRTVNHTSKIRIRRDLSRMQWLLETDESQISKIASRHRKKKGVDIEGKGDDGVIGKAKKALKMQVRYDIWVRC
jgi:hypothetical protein